MEPADPLRKHAQKVILILVHDLVHLAARLAGPQLSEVGELEVVVSTPGLDVPVVWGGAEAIFRPVSTAFGEVDLTRLVIVGRERSWTHSDELRNVAVDTVVVAGDVVTVVSTRLVRIRAQRVGYDLHQDHADALVGERCRLGFDPNLAWLDDPVRVPSDESVGPESLPTVVLAIACFSGPGTSGVKSTEYLVRQIGTT